MSFHTPPHKLPATDAEQPAQSSRDALIADLIKSKSPAHDWSEDFIRAQQALTKFHDIFINRLTPGSDQNYLTPLMEAHRRVVYIIESVTGDVA